MLFDTIAAISTPKGKGGVAMIRISGEDAFAVADKIFCRVGKERLSQAPHALLVRGEICMPDGESVDDGMAVRFCAPRSFTGENTVEIYCHGGVLVTERVLAAALSAGARAAEAGEFTRRAFVSGKLALSEAEALGALLEAKTFSQLRLSRGTMRGNLSRKIEEIYSELLNVMTGIYAAIDYPDEDLNEYSREEITEAVSAALRKTESLLSTYKTGRAISEGVPTVICGRTNAGKSSVYNKIVGSDAAIVTDIEGTTRDVLKQTASLGGVTLLLADTAGIRETEDTVESIGVERALAELEGAELVLAVFDGSRPLCDDDRALIKKIKDTNKPCVALINKTDKGLNDSAAETLRCEFEHSVCISAERGEGFDVLASTVDGMFIDGSIDVDNDAVVSGARQYASLCRAAEALSSASEALCGGVPLDLSCVGIEQALCALNEVDGREIGEEIVAGIFSKFCVGK